MFCLEIVLFVATCICVTEVYGSCNQYDIQYCMKPIYDLRHRLGISDELKYFPIYKLTAQTLDDYCVDGEKAGQCLNNLVGCVSVERNLFKGVLDSFDYLCKKTLNEYKTYQPCLAKSTVFPAVLKCDRDTSQHLKSRKTDVFHDANTQICSIIKDDYSCIRNAVQPECGTKAANWQVTYVNTVLTPILHQVGCNVLPMWAFWVIGIVAGLVLLVVTTIVCVMLVARRKKGKLEANRANHFRNVLSEIPPTSENDVKVV